MSVPQSDLNEFKGKFNSIPCNFITDEDILKKTSQDFGNVPASFPKRLLQQLVKLEFWRMDLCENYVWADSDSYFIRSFSRSNFLHDEGYPYTVQHDLRDLCDFALMWNRIKIIKDFEEMAKKFRNISKRFGVLFDFGPSPVIWSAQVLRSLHDDYLPKKIRVYMHCSRNIHVNYNYMENMFTEAIRYKFCPLGHSLRCFTIRNNSMSLR